jgi:polyvinyl alcohol dehydrogenase (cytochrome)
MLQMRLFRSWVARLAVAPTFFGFFAATATVPVPAAATAIEAAQESSPQAQPQPGLGEATFQRICAACHTSIVSRASPTSDHPPDPMIARALPREMLRQLSAETVLTALTSGKMKAQGSTLTDAERRAVSEYASGSRFGAAAYGSTRTEKPNLCKEQSPVEQFAHAPAWNGWGNGPANLRFQSRAAGGLTAADLPKLKLKWAFGYTNTSTLRAQPTVFGHRLFVATDSGEIYALDAKTGCTYWTHKADASVGTAPSVGPYKTADGKSGYAVYVGDKSANVYALDADSGTVLWKRRVDDHKVAGITGAPTLYKGHLFVPIQGVGEESVGATNGYPCCTFRGSIVALNSSTGEVLWKTYTVEKSMPRGKTANGVELFGPSGGSIWSAPTIDVRRGLLYAGTGNGFSEPSQPGTDAILAMDLKTGAVRWTKQVEGSDNWAMGCAPKNPNNPACPPELGPDYDFAASPALVRANGKDLLIAAQKSGLVYALDPDKQGAIVWQHRYGKGSGLGGQWGVAVDGERFFIGTADLLTPTPGGMHAIAIADGKSIWDVLPQPKLCLKNPGQICSAGQGSAPTAIPGAVLSAGLDGGLRAYSDKDGAILWTFDTNQDFETINGVAARGGGMDHGGAIVVDGMVYLNSGYGGFVGHPGNVLLALGLD